MVLPRFFPGAFWGLFFSLAGCTEPNPEYQMLQDATASCSPGQRQCRGQLTEVCVPQGEGASFTGDGECPAGTNCQGGVCVPANNPCTSTCAGQQVCSIFVDPQQPESLGNFCTNPVGNIPGQMSCSSREQCQSGFCVGRGNDLSCYQACGRSKDCNQLAGYQCLRLTVTVNGVQGQINGCLKK
jgi:hypothetical protein